MSLRDKVELLDQLSQGQSVLSVGRLHGVNKSTIHYIRKNENAIRGSVAASIVPSTEVNTHVQDVHIERMEKALNVWIEDNMQRNMPLSGPFIRAKVMPIYAHLVALVRMMRV